MAVAYIKIPQTEVTSNCFKSIEFWKSRYQCTEIVISISTNISDNFLSKYLFLGSPRVF